MINKFQQALNDISTDYNALLRFWKSGVPSYEYEELKKQVDENISTLQELINQFDMLLDTNNQFEKQNIKLEKALDMACKDCEALDEGLVMETSCDNFKVDDWKTRKKKYLEESEKQ